MLAGQVNNLFSAVTFFVSCMGYKKLKYGHKFLVGEISCKCWKGSRVRDRGLYPGEMGVVMTVYSSL